VSEPDTQRRELHSREFVRLLAQHELRLAGYVHSLIPKWNDAEDVLQETKLRLWDQFDQFRPGAEFLPWALTVANYMVLAYRKKCQRQRLCFSDEVLARIAQQAPEASLLAGDRVSALVRCAEALSVSSRRLLRLFYVERQSVKQIAEEVCQSTAATYQALSRIRRSLRGCIERRLQQEAQA
jgi:RNA polymerase sigma-70 factor (ECF subfamily)